MLFPEPQLNSWQNKRSTPSSLWLKSDISELAERARKRINNWYEKFPDEDSKMANRLLSDDDIHFFQALDELYIHSLLFERWTSVEVELGKETKPDFTCFENNEIKCVIEVASLFEPEASRDAKRKYDLFADEINRLVKPEQGFFVGFHFDDPERIPPIRKFVPWLRRILNELPPYNSGKSEWIEKRFEDESGGLITRFIPMKPDSYTPEMRIVGLGPMIGGIVKTEQRMRDRIDKKSASRYSIPTDTPYLVITAIRDFLGERESPISACYGSTEMNLNTGETRNSLNGLFGFNRNLGKGKRERLSAVGTIQNLVPWDQDLPGIDIFHNPFAKNEWPRDYIPTKRHFGVTSEDEKVVHLGWLNS